jgi:hypothetical protein
MKFEEPVKVGFIGTVFPMEPEVLHKLDEILSTNGISEVRHMGTVGADEQLHTLLLKRFSYPIFIHPPLVTDMIGNCPVNSRVKVLVGKPWESRFREVIDLSDIIIIDEPPNDIYQQEDELVYSPPLETPRNYAVKHHVATIILPRSSTSGTKNGNMRIYQNARRNNSISVHENVIEIARKLEGRRMDC